VDRSWLGLSFDVPNSLPQNPAFHAPANAWVPCVMAAPARSIAPSARAAFVKGPKGFHCRRAFASRVFSFPRLLMLYMEPSYPRGPFYRTMWIRSTVQHPTRLLSPLGRRNIRVGAKNVLRIVF
jgi:hypothetical protein